MQFQNPYEKIYATATYAQWSNALENFENPNIVVALSNPFASLGFIQKIVQQCMSAVEEITNNTKIGVREIISALKTKSVFELLKAVKFNLKNLFKAFQKAMSFGPRKLADLFAKLEQSGHLEKLRSGAMKVDEFLKMHPLLTKAGGVVVAVVLICIWINTMFTGDHKTDFDMTPVFAALSGNYDVVELFASAAGLAAISLLCLNLASAHVQGLAAITGLISYLNDTYLNLFVAVLYTGLMYANKTELAKKLESWIKGKRPMTEQAKVTASAPAYDDVTRQAIEKATKILKEKLESLIDAQQRSSKVDPLTLIKEYLKLWPNIAGGPLQMPAMKAASSITSFRVFTETATQAQNRVDEFFEVVKTQINKYFVANKSIEDIQREKDQKFAERHGQTSMSNHDNIAKNVLPRGYGFTKVRALAMIRGLSRENIQDLNAHGFNIVQYQLDGVALNKSYYKIDLPVFCLTKEYQDNSFTDNVRAEVEQEIYSSTNRRVRLDFMAQAKPKTERVNGELVSLWVYSTGAAANAFHRSTGKPLPSDFRSWELV